MSDLPAEPVSSTPLARAWTIDDIASAFERGKAEGVAEGRRQATEGWDRQWVVRFEHGQYDADNEQDARRAAAHCPDRAEVGSWLVGPWEPAEQPEPAPQRHPTHPFTPNGGQDICVFVDNPSTGGQCGYSRARHQEQPASDRCPACSRPSTSIRDQGDGPKLARKWLPCGCTRIVPVGGDRG